MRTVYAVRFGVAPADADAAAREIGSELATWVSGKYSRVWNKSISLSLSEGSDEPLPGHKIVCTKRAIGQLEQTSLAWTHPHERDSNCLWATTVSVGRDGQRIEVAVTIRLAAIRFEVRPLFFDVGTPRFVRDILKRLDCHVEGDRISTKPIELDALSVQGYVDQTLLSKQRRLPVVAVSPALISGSPLIDPNALQDTLIGFAHVAVLKDKWATFKLADIIGKDLSCYGGAVRIYWPGISISDDKYFHRLFLPESIRLWSGTGVPLDKRIFKTLCSVSTLRATESTLERSLQDQIGESSRKEIAELLERVKSGRATESQLQDDFLKLSYENDALNKRVASLTEELDAQKAAWANVGEFVRQPAASPGDTEDAIGGGADGEYSSVSEAIAAAKKKFSGPLLFLDSAVESAGESPYQNPDRVYQLF